MFKFSLHPGKTNIDFLRYRIAALVFTALLTVATIGLVVGKGLNFGIDFTGKCDVTPNMQCQNVPKQVL